MTDSKVRRRSPEPCTGAPVAPDGMKMVQGWGSSLGSDPFLGQADLSGIHLGTRRNVEGVDPVVPSLRLMVESLESLRE